MCPPLFTSLSMVYQNFFNQLVTTLTTFDPVQENQVIFQLNVLTVTTRILSHIFSNGWAIIEDAQEPQVWISQTLSNAGQLFQLRSSVLQHSAIASLLHKQLVILFKLYKIESKRTFLAQPLFEYCWTVVNGAGQDAASIEDDPASRYPTSLIVYSLTTIRNVLTMWPSTESSSNESMPQPEDAFQQQLKNWSQECSLLLITKLIPMREADLQLWLDEPEEWLNEEEAERDEIDLRVRLSFLVVSAC